MNWFKRLCLFLFGLSGLLALAFLSLTWVGPWTVQFRSYLEIPWVFVALEVVVCVAAFGLLVCVLYALFKPRSPKETVIAVLPGGTIAVTRMAVMSQARHIIETDGSCIASSVRVRMHKRGHVRVMAQVTPRYPINVSDRSVLMHEELEQGLSKICGDNIKSISLVFKDPQQLEMPVVSEVDEFALDVDENSSVIIQGGTKVIANKRGDDITIAPAELAAMLGKGMTRNAENPLLANEGHVTDEVPVASDQVPDSSVPSVETGDSVSMQQGEVVIRLDVDEEV